MDILVAVGLQLQFSLSLLQPTFMAEGSEGFIQCADILASCLSLKLASNGIGNMLFLVTLVDEFVVISSLSAYNIPLLVFLITVLNEPLPMENATLFDQILNECQEELPSSFIQLSGVESHLKEGDLNLM
jgi:hypothetical protein